MVKPLVIGGTLAFLLGTGLFLLMLGSCYVYYQLGDLIVPGVRVGDRNLGGKTVTEAAVIVHSDWNLTHQIRVSDGIQTWQIRPADLGVWVDAVETARQAYAVGRREGQVRRIAEMWSAARGEQAVVPVVKLNLQQTQTKLLSFAETTRQAPKDAALQWNGSGFSEVPAELGYEIDTEKTLTTFPTQAERVLLAGYLELPLKPLLPAVNDVSPIKAQAEAIINSSPPLRVYDPITDETLSLALSQDVVGGWIVAGIGDEGPVVAIDPARVRGYLVSLEGELSGGRYLDPAQAETVAQALQSGAAPTLIARHRPTSYVVQPGDTLISIGWRVEIPFWMILQANPDLDPDNLFAGQSLAIPSRDALLPYPVVLGKRVVIDISSQRLDIYENGERLSRNRISTGIDRSPTQPGVFQVQTHERTAYASVWDLYMPHFLGIYEAWPGFMNGIHGLPTLSNGRRLWANILGSPASYGCIILDLDTAEWLYNWAEQGVVVEIRE